MSYNASCEASSYGELDMNQNFDYSQEERCQMLSEGREDNGTTLCDSFGALVRESMHVVHSLHIPCEITTTIETVDEVTNTNEVYYFEPNPSCTWGSFQQYTEVQSAETFALEKSSQQESSVSPASNLNISLKSAFKPLKDSTMFTKSSLPSNKKAWEILMKAAKEASDILGADGGVKKICFKRSVP